MILVEADKHSQAGVLPAVIDGPFADGEVETRQVFEASDFGPAFTPAHREAEERTRARVAAKRSSWRRSW